MPYILSPLISENMTGLWLEGTPYERDSIYSMSENEPPINYDLHSFKPHSLTHVETPAHTQASGHRLGHYYNNRPDIFFGDCVVVKLKGSHWNKISTNENIYHWEVSLEQLKQGIYDAANSDSIPDRILLTAETAPILSNGFHDPDYVLTLSQEAANFLVNSESFKLYGTSWKSTDFQPKSRERPIHNTLFQKALIFELLILSNVPQGKYFLSAFPIPVKEASEALVCPVLFTAEELETQISHLK